MFVDRKEGFGQFWHTAQYERKNRNWQSRAKRTNFVTFLCDLTFKKLPVSYPGNEE